MLVTAMTVILGIDPGSRKTGFGIIRIDRKQPIYVSSGTIRLPVKEPLSVRLRVLFESLSEIVDTHRPTVAAIESVFMAKSADSALKLGHARGAAMVACVIVRFPCCPPRHCCNQNPAWLVSPREPRWPPAGKGT